MSLRSIPRGQRQESTHPGRTAAARPSFERNKGRVSSSMESSTLLCQQQPPSLRQTGLSKA